MKTLIKKLVIDRDYLNSVGACDEGLEWFVEEGITDPIKGIKNLIKYEKLDWANWLICRVFTKEQKVRYAVYAAKQVLKLFQEKYPDDKRPALAIKAAERYLKTGNTDGLCAAANAAYAAYAADAAYAANAADAAYAAYAAYAADAAYAAAYAANAANAANAADAAYAAAYAAYAANAAANAAYAAAYAAYAADAADAADAKRKLKIKVLNYGLKLLANG